MGMIYFGGIAAEGITGWATIFADQAATARPSPSRWPASAAWSCATAATATLSLWLSRWVIAIK
jgi:hypothetical protein